MEEGEGGGERGMEAGAAGGGAGLGGMSVLHDVKSQMQSSPLKLCKLHDAISGFTKLKLLRLSFVSLSDGRL